MDKFKKRERWGHHVSNNVREFYEVISEACEQQGKIETTEITAYNRTTCNLNENYNPSFNIRAFSHLYCL